jgi:hypothetical protein
MMISALLQIGGLSIIVALLLLVVSERLSTWRTVGSGGSSLFEKLTWAGGQVMLLLGLVTFIAAFGVWLLNGF